MTSESKYHEYHFWGVSAQKTGRRFLGIVPIRRVTSDFGGLTVEVARPTLLWAVVAGRRAIRNSTYRRWAGR